MSRLKKFISNISENKVFKSKTFNFVMIVVNVLAIVILLIWLAVSIISDNEKKEIDNSGSNLNMEQNVGDVDVDSLVEEADKSMVGVYEALIRGTSFDCGNGVKFEFGLEGEYAGFFDAKNKDVTGYSYEVATGDEKTLKLRIYNEDKTRYVEYAMKFNSDGNILLTYPGTDQAFLLEF
ncbi:MAG: hypothetical protein IJ958_02565 [Agathobacter sp.]|nr:hypothetical protein [Agathobacter sp.]